MKRLLTSHYVLVRGPCDGHAWIIEQSLVMSLSCSYVAAHSELEEVQMMGSMYEEACMGSLCTCRDKNESDKHLTRYASGFRSRWLVQSFSEKTLMGSLCACMRPL